tara:strand:- start:557 stop:811 length:255 start_codon:yes stop_codon:yes gene_type:complete
MANKGINAAIYPRRNDTPERMIRRFTKKVKKLGIIDEIKKRRYYEKPSIAKRRKAAERKRMLERLEKKAKARKKTNYRKRRRQS